METQLGTESAKPARVWFVAAVSYVHTRALEPALSLTVSPAQRSAVVGLVALVHVALIGALMLGVLPATPKIQKETELVLAGGPVGIRRAPPDLSGLVQPLEVGPPPIEIVAAALVESAAPPQGSPNVTRPAMAVADAHVFPQLPADLASHVRATVRLLLMLRSDGTVARAELSSTSGIAVLDQLAIQWVERHWRYLPALENGLAIPSATIAVVSFSAP